MSCLVEAFCGSELGIIHETLSIPFELFAKWDALNLKQRARWSRDETHALSARPDQNSDLISNQTVQGAERSSVKLPVENQLNQVLVELLQARKIVDTER